jgi:hypothetical protein
MADVEDTGEFSTIGLTSINAIEKIVTDKAVTYTIKMTSDFFGLSVEINISFTLILDEDFAIDFPDFAGYDSDADEDESAVEDVPAVVAE